LLVLSYLYHYVYVLYFFVYFYFYGRNTDLQLGVKYPMADNAVAIVLNPSVVVALIDLLRSLLDTSSSTLGNFRTDLQSVKVSLGLIRDVLDVIESRNRRNLTDGIRNWEAEAQAAVGDAETLIKRIDTNNPHSDLDPIRCWPVMINRNVLNYGPQDEGELRDLRNRLDGITNQNATVLALLRGREVESECGCCPF
jgi:Rx N-terminal domain